MPELKTSKAHPVATGHRTGMRQRVRACGGEPRQTLV
jgi:hypothetical protein